MSTATYPAPTLDTKPADLVKIAAEVFDLRPNWITFFREVLGAQGIIRQVCDTPEKLAAFERTSDFRDIQQMLAKLRDNDPDVPGRPRERTSVITMRLPVSVHQALKAEAHDRNLSMNQLCVAKVLQVLDESACR